MILNFSKVRSDVVVPTRANPSDAGLDFYYCPEEEKTVILRSGETALFATGIRMEIPHGYYLEIKNRSGNAYKRQLLVGACVVDSGYSGEIFVNLHNVGLSNVEIEPGQKIAQGVFVKVEQPLLVEIGEDNIYGGTTDRGAGALGSTGDF